MIKIAATATPIQIDSLSTSTQAGTSVGASSLSGSHNANVVSTFPTVPGGLGHNMSMRVQKTRRDPDDIIKEASLFSFDNILYKYHYLGVRRIRRNNAEGFNSIVKQWKQRLQIILIDGKVKRNNILRRKPSQSFHSDPPYSAL